MFSGSIPALATPFSGGSFDEHAFRQLVDWQIDNGSAALVPCGTTGEASTLSNAEHHRVIEVCIEQAAGRVPVIAGCGSNDTRNAALHMKHRANRHKRQKARPTKVPWLQQARTLEALDALTLCPRSLT